MTTCSCIYEFMFTYTIISYHHLSSLRANPLARSPGQVKLDSDKKKLRKNLFEEIEKKYKFGFRGKYIEK